MNKVKQRTGFLMYVLIGLIMLTGINACSKNDPDNVFIFVSTLDGLHALPSNTVTATGTCNITYDSIKNKLAYTITWKGLSGTPTAVNFQVPDGSSGYINIPVTNTFSPNGVSDYITIDQQYEAALLNNGWYVNVITATYGDGEIRGQITKKE